MYILNINKSYGTNTPQILGRVADLPYMDFEFMFKDGTKAVDLTGCTVEFRGLTSTDNKIISTESVTPKDPMNGTIKFKVPKNFYSAPGAFKRAYFAIKKSGRIDTTQDVIIHVLDSVDMDAQDAQDVIDAVDKIIADVEKQVKSETDRLIQQIKNDTASTIADSNKKLADLDKQINDFKTNTNSTISQINGEINKLNNKVNSSNSEIVKLQARIDELFNQLEDKDLVTKGYLNSLKLDTNNYFSISNSVDDHLLAWDTGIPGKEDGSVASGWIKVEPGTVIHSSHEVNQWMFYNNGKQYVGGRAYNGYISKVPKYEDIGGYGWTLPTESPADKNIEFMRLVYRNNFLSSYKKSEITINQGDYKQKWTQSMDDIMTRQNSVVPGFNILTRTSRELKPVGVPQWHIPASDRASFYDNDVFVGDVLVGGAYIKVPKTASQPVCARLNLWTSDSSDYQAVLGNFIYPGEEGFSRVSVEVLHSKYLEASISLQKLRSAEVGVVDIFYKGSFLYVNDVSGRWSVSHNNLQEQIDDLKKAITALGGS